MTGRSFVTSRPRFMSSRLTRPRPTGRWPGTRPSWCWPARGPGRPAASAGPMRPPRPRASSPACWPGSSPDAVPWTYPGRPRPALARDVIGPDAELYVDANGGYTAGQAVRVGQRLADQGVTWFEEPVSSQDVA